MESMPEGRTITFTANGGTVVLQCVRAAIPVMRATHDNYCHVHLGHFSQATWDRCTCLAERGEVYRVSILRSSSGAEVDELRYSWSSEASARVYARTMAVALVRGCTVDQLVERRLADGAGRHRILADG